MDVFKAVAPIVGGIFGGPVGALAGGLLGGLLGGKAGNDQAATPPPPALEKPTIMPTPDDRAVKEAARRKMAVQNSQRTSRANTILSQPDDLLGG